MKNIFLMKKDQFQRFDARQSLAYQQQFIKLPLIDLWMCQLKKELLLLQSSLIFKPHEFQYIPTYDIDIAYSYKGKGFIRNAGGLLLDFFKGNFSKVIERLKVIFNQQADPYDSYQFLDACHKHIVEKPIYFFLLGQGAKFDKNLNPEGKWMRNLIQEIGSKYHIGIHPSYASHNNEATLQSELKQIDTSKSRQHYIKFELPYTYQTLIRNGITDDYSMGYGTHNGFRASTSFGHNWFDLSKNESTQLRIHPFCFMECNSYFQQKNTVEEAYAEMLHFKKVIQAVKGTYISIWHNFSLGSELQWKGWKEMYLRFLKEINT